MNRGVAGHFGHYSGGVAAAVLVAVTLLQQRRRGCLETEGPKSGGDVLSLCSSSSS